MSDLRPLVLVYAQDLFFGVRVQDVVEQMGGRAKLVGSAAELAEGLAQTPVLALIELGPGGRGDWVQVVQRARKWTRGIPIIAFGSHLDGAARAVARSAQCDEVWSKSRFVQELPSLVAAHVQPQQALAGCDEPLPPRVEEGLALFNRGQYYRCHDALEEAWVSERRPCRNLYQGILQLAIALHHIEGENFGGADKMFRRAISKFQRLPAQCQGLDVAALLAQTRKLHERLLALGPEQIAAFPRSLFPTIPNKRLAPREG